MEEAYYFELKNIQFAYLNNSYDIHCALRIRPFLICLTKNIKGFTCKDSSYIQK